jgi:phage tail-like protein
MKKKTPREYTGLDLYAALGRIKEDFPELEAGDIELTYKESPLPRFTVLSCNFAGISHNRLRIEAASGNPLRHLPSNYQENSFLRGFLMVFQHIMNETSLKLDNLHSWFKPMECPPSFLSVLADWLGLHGDTSGSGEELRRFLRCAIPLYRCRGTALGMKVRLGLACGVLPQIIEGELPHSALVISDEVLSANGVRILETESTADCFTVYFPVPREHFSEDLTRRMALIAEREKPAHMKCYIGFARPVKKRRKITTIQEETFMDAEGGFFI